VTSPPSHLDLAAVFARQRDRDLVGPGPLDDQIRHAEAFAGVADAARAGALTVRPSAADGRSGAAGPPRRVIDLGSGGGLPGLVLAVSAWPEAEVALVDSSQRRCTYLELEVAPLSPRVKVVWARAEMLGRDDAWRATADVVVARSFGPPPVVAECAAPLLHVGGVLVVSDPPTGGDRWDDEGLRRVGLLRLASPRVDGFGFTVARQVDPCPDRYPRRRPDRDPIF